MPPPRSALLACAALSLLLSACSPALPAPPPPAAPAPATSRPAANPALPPAGKWALWTSGTLLRGANIYQRRVFPEVDGGEFIGPGPFGPPYTQADFDRLAALGANYVNLSTAGLFTVEPPYLPDEEAAAALDSLLALAARADLFAVITFRTGPGRSEFAIIGGGDWLPDGYIIETVWSDPGARSAWEAMWRYTAERYRANPIVIGYDLMCEPNANNSLDIWDPQEFHDRYEGTGYDWNSWYPRLVDAIREVDGETPILVGGNGYSGVEWLPWLETVDDPQVVYTFHQYSPHEYTHQEPPFVLNAYPGWFDADYDGQPDQVDAAWLQDLLAQAAAFQAEHGVPVAVNEYGIERWVPGSAEFVRDEMELFETYGWNYAAWMWHASWAALAEGDNSFNFLFGPLPGNLVEIPNALLEAYTTAWSRNLVRPSTWQP